MKATTNRRFLSIGKQGLIRQWIDSRGLSGNDLQRFTLAACVLYLWVGIRLEGAVFLTKSPVRLSSCSAGAFVSFAPGSFSTISNDGSTNSEALGDLALSVNEGYAQGVSWPQPGGADSVAIASQRSSFHSPTGVVDTLAGTPSLAVDATFTAHLKADVSGFQAYPQSPFANTSQRIVFEFQVDKPTACTLFLSATNAGSGAWAELATTNGTTLAKSYPTSFPLTRMLEIGTVYRFSAQSDIDLGSTGLIDSQVEVHFHIAEMNNDAVMAVVLQPPRAPRLQVNGTTGGRYQIDYCASLKPDAVWLPLTNISVPSAPYELNVSLQSISTYKIAFLRGLLGPE
ncbi:MAG TPA: hypothetical protein VMF06_13215 [Candidatus Limnocylindria bacterium]|nr:hypothetical protein [Candidatus Limnocylindria bacterium]